MISENLKFSVVTVCLNVQDTIAETIHSIRQQTYTNYEYIIWDGKSKDSTLDIIYQSMDESHMKIFSEKDTGLYNAMNRAIEHCSGDYVIFINSGDTLADTKVLEDVAHYIMQDKEQADLYFGNVFRKMEQEEILETYKGKDIVFKLLLVGRMPCHQSIFTSLDVMKQYRFDENYSITADYNFLMKCRKNHKKIQYIDRVISRFDCTQGISAQTSNLEEMRRQDDRSMKELYPVWYYIMKPIKSVVRSYKRRKLKE